MIPFNHLGWFFKYLGPVAYPKGAIEALCDFLRPVAANAPLLDLGSGTGVLSEFAYSCRKDFAFVALDPAEGMLKFSPEYVRTHTARAEALPFEASSFEVVLIGEALHHFQSPERAMAEIVRVLRRGGRLFIYEFDPSTFMGRSLCIAEKLLGEPGHFFAPEVLKEMLEKHGFFVSVNRYGWRYTIHAELN
ncbi:class I SAM-dependent methyltransferase [Sulfurimonas sp. HSL3-7]|uniref:class I SAM-dependent methyltransferase n=1 Tax=Sulfonitrofixus jiaomeiensis TaxID=3131938 RepID=UPI0031F95908